MKVVLHFSVILFTRSHLVIIALLITKENTTIIRLCLVSMEGF